MQALLERESRTDLDLDPGLLDRYLAMYANADTIEAPPDVQVAIDELFARARARGLLDGAARVEFAPSGA